MDAMMDFPVVFGSNELTFFPSSRILPNSSSGSVSGAVRFERGPIEELMNRTTPRGAERS